MEYTNETLHGLIYQHKSGGPCYRIIQVYDQKFSHTTCNLVDGITVQPWIKLDVANHWIETGVWILQEQPSKIINNYQIY
jgi:hypothetical protein